jgi:hypothetical protein
MHVRRSPLVSLAVLKPIYKLTTDKVPMHRMNFSKVCADEQQLHGAPVIEE